MLKGRLAGLRPACEKDIETLTPWTLDPELCRLLYGSVLNSKNEQTVHLRSIIKQQASPFPAALLYMIETRSKIPIGFLNLHSIDWKNGSLMNDMAIAKEEYRAKGASIEIICLTLDLVFKELNMNKLCGNVHDFNKASLGLYRKCTPFGIEPEGTLRQHVFRAGAYHDSHVFSILKKDYLKKAQLLKKLAGLGTQ